MAVAIRMSLSIGRKLFAVHVTTPFVKLGKGETVMKNIEVLAEKRKTYLKLAEMIEAKLVVLVRREYKKGASLRSLARAVGVTHPTIRKWIEQ